MKIALDRITVGDDRLRRASPVFLPRIQASLADVGLQQPVILHDCGDGTRLLVDGLHRVTAAKALGWTHIEAKMTEFPVEWSPERVKLELRKIEVDNNLARANLTQTEQTVFVAEKTRVTMEIQAVDEKDKTAKEATEANARRSLALALANDAVTPEAKEHAGKHLAKVETERVNATQKAKRAEERCNEISVSHGQNVTSNIKGMGEVRRKVAEEIGLSPRTLEHMHKFTRYLGMDLLKEIQGSKLDSYEQLTALVSLKNRVEMYANKNWAKDDQEAQLRKAYSGKYADLWNRIVASLKAGKCLDAHKEYSELASDEGREVKDYLGMLSMRTPETQWKVAAEKLKEAALAVGEVMLMAESKTATQQIKAKHKQLEQAHRMIADLRSWAFGGRDSMKEAKITGNEGKYVGVSPEASERKRMAKADQNTNANGAAKTVTTKVGTRKTASVAYAIPS